METKHTPGPWRYRQPISDRLRGQPIRSLEVLVDGPNGIYKPYVADVRSLDAAGNDNTEANARLIAAAPDLLAALESIASSGLAKDSADARFLCGIARAAIAKVRGE
jgi:hypothetical protein